MSNTYWASFEYDHFFYGYDYCDVLGTVNDGK